MANNDKRNEVTNCVSVPREPTQAMIDAGEKATCDWLTAAVADGVPADGSRVEQWVYRAMLAAAPSPPGDLLPCECGQMPRSSAKRSWCVNEACPRFGEDFLTVTWPKAATRPAAPDWEVCTCEDERQCQGCAAGRRASDAARLAPVALSSEERKTYDAAVLAADIPGVSITGPFLRQLLAIIARLTTNEPKGNDRG
jgi:hypothetical protein